MQKLNIPRISGVFISPWVIAGHFSSLLWYLALFPGRLGSDPIQAINLIRAGESTDWWSPLYFWFLRITTMGGDSLWFASLFSLIPLQLTFLFFVMSFPLNSHILVKGYFLVCISPLFGNFAVNINHDTFIVAGTFLISGISMRELAKTGRRVHPAIPYVAIFLLLNSKTGYALILAFLGYLILTKKKFLKIASISLFAAAMFLVTGIGITKSPVPMHLLPILADIKCVTQHPEARITNTEWQYLSTIAELELWKKPLSCASMDDAIVDIRNPKLQTLKDGELLKTYLGILTRNPAIMIQAHFQRSSQALPPPFFQGPQNQVDRDIRNPVGLNTNIALQLGPEVLHPSIDDPELKLERNPFSVLEKTFLFFSFLINQASWFWGWGGLWLWPILLFQLKVLKIRKIRTLLAINYPIILNHLLHVAIGPIPVPRYVMSTILIGYTVTIFFLLKWWQDNKTSESFENS